MREKSTHRREVYILHERGNVWTEETNQVLERSNYSWWWWVGRDTLISIASSEAGSV